MKVRVSPSDAIEQLCRYEEGNILSNMLIIPITLYLCNHLRSFEKTLEFLPTHWQAHLSDICGLTSATETRSS